MGRRNQPDEGMRDFQNANCAKDCRFANEAKVGSGLPCCNFGAGLISDGETCFTRASKDKDPFFTCQVCKGTQQYSRITGNSNARDDLYRMRVCGWECGKKLNEGGNS